MIFKKPSLFLKDKKWKSEKEKARGVGQEKKTTQVKSYFFFYIWKILKKNIIDSRVIIVLGGLLFMFFVPSILRNTLLKSRQKSLTQQFPFLSLSLSLSLDSPLFVREIPCEEYFTILYNITDVRIISVLVNEFIFQRE